MKKSTLLCSLGTAFILLSGAFTSNALAAKTIGGYKQVTRLGGTSQSICRPAIHTAQELQSFALNQRQDVLDILKTANWSGNANDVFAAIEAGNFSERSFPVGTKLEWMGMRKGGKPTAGAKRQWAGKHAFEGFELNLVSNCQLHQLVIPKACCNVSLISSSTISIADPSLTTRNDGQNATITVDSNGFGEITELRHPDGRVETLTLTNGTWSGTLSPGNYSVVSRTATNCGESSAVTSNIIIPAAPVAVVEQVKLAPAGGLFIAPFIGRQIRSIDPPLVGVTVGYSRPIPQHDRLSWFVQGGGSYNTKAKELSIFTDVGLEHKVGANGFVGAGAGLWDINNSDDLPNSTSPKKDVSYFIHGGSDTKWNVAGKPVQWFAEARIFDDFTDDISNHNILRLGVRIQP